MDKKKNERVTENIVREHFRGDDFLRASRAMLEEQQSRNPRINKLLQNASKKGPGAGLPDFILSFRDLPQFVAVVECKADRAKHESDNRDQYADFAVDGALLYSSYLSKEFDVLSIAVSGQTAGDAKITHHLQKKNKAAELIFGKQLLPLADYIGGYVQDEQKRSEKYEDLLAYSKDLNSYLHTLKIKEDKRSLLLSGILIALEEKSFRKVYSNLASRQLADFLVQTISNQFKTANLQDDKLQKLRQNYDFIKTHTSLVKPGETLKNLADDIDDNINGFARTYKYYDVLGQFYIEFLRYSNADKGLGIVLTPPHITEFFADVADVKATDVVFDNCAGTGGFLVAAMKKMIGRAAGDSKLENRIKQKQLFGVEYQPEIYPLAVSNMFLHGDGKSNIADGDCFDAETVALNKQKNPTIGLLNPPYKKSKSGDTDELEFVLNNLQCLQKHGRCVAIVPMRCMLTQKGRGLTLKEKLLENHTLRAVFSMPGELFFNSKVGVVTAVVALEAHVPHPEKVPTFFGYFKDDGFTKRKAKGRFDYRQKWGEIKNRWLDLYFSNQPAPGLSVVKKVRAKDEWCAEAYMETDYSGLSAADFQETLLQYSSFLFSNKKIDKASGASLVKKETAIKKMNYFCLADLFDITGSRTTPPLELEEKPAGQYPYITTQATNNGAGGFFNFYTEKGGVLTVDSAVVGYCSFQRDNFSASDHVEKLIPKFNLNPYIAMFLTTILNREQYRYNYGRKAGQTRLRRAKIKLPVDKNNRPDWRLMECYIKSLPYSCNL